MASLPVSPLPAEGTHPSGSQGNRNASDIANKDVAGVTTSPAQIFPTDKPPTLQGKNQTEKVHADLPSSAPPLQNVTMTPVPTPSPDFKKGAASNNGTSQNGIPVPQQKMSSASTAGLQTTVTPVSVATLSGTTDKSNSGMQGTIAAIVLPIVGLLVILAIVVLFIKRRKCRRNGYRRKGNHDEENSSETTSALMAEDFPTGTQINSTEEPLYAVVDKSKKRKNTESSSMADETVPLKSFNITTNGSCPAVSGSEDSLLQGSSPRDDVEEVFTVEDVQRLEDDRIYDVPPNEQTEDDVCDTVTNINTKGIVQDEKNKDNQEGAHAVNATNAARSVSDSDNDGLDGPREDITIVECDLYESTEADDSKSDADSTYEIPDSPATVRARASKDLQNRALRPTSIKMPLNLCLPQSSDSESGLDSDFEEIATRHRPSSMENSKDTEELNKGLEAPPVPLLPPESDTDSEYYMSPECHTHRPPGPGWKPFHEYDPVYIPHSDPVGMDRRVDNQNYVRGRQRSDSRMTHPYEEIQFSGIYATVDGEDSLPVTNGQPETSFWKPPLPPPIVPKRTRPISGVADMGRLSIHRAIEPEKNQEPRYSGLIKDDVSDPDDDTPHEYTALEYTKLRTQESGPMISDDIKHIDDTDSETYAKQAAPPLLKRRKGSDAKEVLPNGDKPPGSYCPLIKQDYGQVYNGKENDESDKYNSSSDSDDSYEPVDFHPPDSPQAKEGS